MKKQTEFKKLQKENDEIRKSIYTLLNDYMMSDERDDTLELIDRLVNNELDQEKLCGE